MELVQEYLIEEALIIVPVLLIFGFLLKTTPSIKDWIIPYVLLLIGIVLSLLLLGLTVEAFMQGVLVTGVAVLGNQLYRQTQKKDVQ